MKKEILVSGLVIICLLGSVAINKQPAFAGYSRCKSNRNAYCLRHGDRGSRVYNLIERLRCAGYYNVGNDSWFGPVTDRGVRRFQRDYGLTPDGVVGPQTLRVLDRVCSGQTRKRPSAVSNRSSNSTYTMLYYHLFASNYSAVYSLGSRNCVLTGSNNGSNLRSVSRQEAKDYGRQYTLLERESGNINSLDADIAKCLRSKGKYLKYGPGL